MGEKQIDRRKMLKTAMAAGGAITAAAFLEGKWLKPMVKSGVLPAHAQATCPYIFFLPVTEDNNPVDASGTGDLMAVGAFPSVTTIPNIANLVQINGPITFEILSFTGFDNLSPLGPLSGQMIDGIWQANPAEGLPPTTPIQTFTYVNVLDTATITVRWTLNGCTYNFTYDIAWAPTVP